MKKTHHLHPERNEEEDETNYDGDSEPPVALRGQRRRRQSRGDDSIIIVPAITTRNEEEEPSSSVGSPSAETTERSKVACRTTIAIQMAAMQASFAEKTAEEMKQIVDWYSTCKQEDRFVKIKQKKSLPDNAMVCLDEEDDDLEISSANVPASNAYRDSSCPGPTVRDDDSHHSESLTPRMCKSNVPISVESPLPGRKAVSSGVDVDSSSPSSLSTNSSQNESSLSNPTTPYSSRKQAAAQDVQIKNLLNATQFMADVVLEYEQTSSSSDANTTITTSRSAAWEPSSVAPRKDTVTSPTVVTTFKSVPDRRRSGGPRKQRPKKKKARWMLVALFATLFSIVVLWYAARKWGLATPSISMSSTSQYGAFSKESVVTKECEIEQECPSQVPHQIITTLMTTRTTTVAYRSGQKAIYEEREEKVIVTS